MSELSGKCYVLLIILLAIAFLTGCSSGVTINVDMQDYNITIKEVYTDKAMYSPEEEVKLSAVLYTERNPEITTDNEQGNSKPVTANICVRVMHLESQIGKEISVPAVLTVGEDSRAVVTWTAPKEDYKGYLLEISVQDKNDTVMAEESIGVDVSSCWTKFPRYGYVCNFSADANATEKLELLNRYHINGIEYYDWHYLHHQPLADGITAEEPGEWKDWSGRRISGATVKSYIETAKAKNMVSMAYDMIYAGTDTFFKDGDGNPTEAEAWKILFAPQNTRGVGEFKFRMGNSPSGNGNLFFVNPLNPDWQTYIFNQINQCIDVFDFDGWHGDTVGDWGEMTTADGNPLGYREDGTPIYLVKETYTKFINAAKGALGERYFTFNPVGAQGIEAANVSNADVLYTEFWPWDKDRNGRAYDSYNSLTDEIERTFDDSRGNSPDGKGKSLVVKAYVNYNKKSGTMNEAGVLLLDAAVYAAGGSRLELGNGDRMLHVEYYPNDYILMSEELKYKEKKLYDFIVAYENLLRDGQESTENEVEIEATAVSTRGLTDSVWTMTKEDDRYEILHLINLVGTDNQWRDESGKKYTPEVQNNMSIRYYTTSDIDKIYLASPDEKLAVSRELHFTEGEDEKGAYISFTVPSLIYWDMIYMIKASY